MTPELPVARMRPACALLAAVLMPMKANAEPPTSEATDFVFEVADIGFCNLPEMSGTELREVIARIQDDLPLTGTFAAPAEAGLFGSGHFIRSSGGDAIAASMARLPVCRGCAS